MAVIKEDFIRCECGNADFIEQEIVTLPTGLKKRYINELSLRHPTLEKRVDYICTKCKKKQDI